MHVVKVALLLILTLAVMRAGSWLIGWAVCRLARASRLASSLAGNGAALALFLGFLVWNRMPGEFLDLEPAAFGVVVFGLYQLIDFTWWPWERSRAHGPTR